MSANLSYFVTYSLQPHHSNPTLCRPQLRVRCASAALATKLLDSVRIGRIRQQAPCVVLFEWAQWSPALAHLVGGVPVEGTRTASVQPTVAVVKGVAERWGLSEAGADRAARADRTSRRDRSGPNSVG